MLPLLMWMLTMTNLIVVLITTQWTSLPISSSLTLMYLVVLSKRTRQRLRILDKTYYNSQAC